MKKLIWKLLNIIGIGPWIQLAVRSELKENGWYKSFIEKKPINRKGEPIPWLTYAFIDFIKPRLHRDMIMFEYGCGNSTLWFASLVKHIDSVEHEEGWFQEISSKVPSNVQIYFKSLETNEYEQSVMLTPYFYDLILVDGRKRLECVQCAVQKLSDNGVIIVDNSECYPEIFDFLRYLGFKEISFWGIPPIVPLKTCTTTFYKENNCLGI